MVDPVASEQSKVLFLVFNSRKIGNNNAINACIPASAEEVLQAHLQDGVQVTHQYQRHADPLSDPFQLMEQQVQGHAIPERLQTALLNDRPVGKGIRKRYPDFHHIRAIFLQQLQEPHRIMEFGVTGSHIDGKDLRFLLFEQLIDSVCHSRSDFQMFNIGFHILVPPAR